MPVRSPSETSESAKRVGSCRDEPERCRLWRALVRAVARRSHPASLLGRRSAPRLCGPAWAVKAPHGPEDQPFRPHHRRPGPARDPSRATPQAAASFLTSVLDLPDLADDDAQPRYVALQLGQGVGRQRHALRGVHACQTLSRLAQGWFEVANAQPGQGRLYSVDDPRAFADQAVALAAPALGVLFGNRGHARHAAMAPFSTQPPQEPAFQQLGVEPVSLCSAMLPRDRDTRGMDHVRLYPTRRKPARQPEAVAAGFEGQRNPGDRAAGPDRLIPPAMQQAKQPFWARLEVLARLTLNARNHAGKQPARQAHLNYGDDRAILVKGDEGSAQVVRLGHRATPSVTCSDEVAISRRPPHSIYRSRCERNGRCQFQRSDPGRSNT